MRTLVIPDIHLKPWIVDGAEEIYQNEKPDVTVFLGDIADDWNQQYNIPLYERTFERVIEYCSEHTANTWFCYGNHDISYVWKVMQSGFSGYAIETVRNMLEELKKALPDEHIGFMHAIDGCLFSHAGLTREFALANLDKNEDPEAIAKAVNSLNGGILWEGDSPIWARPQGKQTEYSSEKMWPAGILQVVGHTPTAEILVQGDMISVDVFSTYRDSSPIGTQELAIVDTTTRNIEKFKIRG
ncbi:MAG: metallophosphoesterase [Lachnospiraceae bacterium]|nr:metallophosphoesterase [Lachnospiraceae bacterium]